MHQCVLSAIATIRNIVRELATRDKPDFPVELFNACLCKTTVICESGSTYKYQSRTECIDYAQLYIFLPCFHTDIGVAVGFTEASHTA